VRSRKGREMVRRGAVHGAGYSGELGRNSGEALPRVEAESARAEASTGCAMTRRGDGEDGGGCGEPERRLGRWRSSGAGNGEGGALRLLLRARMEGAARRTSARRGSRRARTLRGPQGACRSARRRTDTRRPNAAAAPRRHARARARAGEREGTTRTRAGPALAVGREVRAKPSNEISIFLFPNIFQILHFCLKFKFEDENEVFRNLSQNKSCSKFYSLQLSYRTFFQIPNRF
jgi:hypothetical protein